MISGPTRWAPRRIAADYLAFYQTSAFSPGRALGCALAGAGQSYRLATRRELIPEEPAHPRADQSYYKVTLGPMASLPHTVAGRRLRRITFIPTTLSRLLEAQEINDLWIKSSAQERLWAALKLADIDAERQYPLADDLPAADFALLCRDWPCSRTHSRRADDRRRIAGSAATRLPAGRGRLGRGAAHDRRTGRRRSRGLSLVCPH